MNESDPILLFYLRGNEGAGAVTLFCLRLEDTMEQFKTMSTSSVTSGM